MANLDTRSKRASSLQVMQPWQTSQNAPTLVTGDIDQGDRQHIAWSYSGILAASATFQAAWAIGSNFVFQPGRV